MNQRLLLNAIVVLSLVAVLGCTKNPKGVAPVTGTVTLDGAVVSDATVTFVPVTDGQGEMATGKTDKEGKFQLNTANSPIMGAIPADYDVIIVKKDANYDEVVEIRDDGPGAGGGEGGAAVDFSVPEVVHLLPVQYSKRGQSGLKATVVKGQNDIAFELVSE